MTAQQRYQLDRPAACVLADGPQETDGDGGYEYTVCFGDAEGEPIDNNLKAIWRLWEYEEVRRFGHQLADRFHLEFINETSCP